MTATLVTDVSNGTLALNENGSFTYTPAADFPPGPTSWR
ncbi:MAG: Ig-like domain-containing protein [Candidatus Poribacteria bacterium]